MYHHATGGGRRKRRPRQPPGWKVVPARRTVAGGVPGGERLGPTSLLEGVVSDRTVRILQDDGTWLDAPWDALRAGMTFEAFESDGSPANGGGRLIALSDVAADDPTGMLETMPWSEMAGKQAAAWAKAPSHYLHPAESARWDALIERVTLFFLRHGRGYRTDWPAGTINGWIAELVTLEQPTPETEELLVELLAERAREVPRAMTRRASLLVRLLKRGERVLQNRDAEEAG